jgi:parvulin-like peptidyl-prolyl isomerase
MARNPKQRIVTKKHLARLQREERQRRFILIGAIIVIVLVLGLIGFGLLDQYYLSSIRPVADVNGERITTAQFQAQTRYTRQRLINNAVQSAQIMQYFGNSAEMLASVQNQISQIEAQLDPQVAGQGTLDQLIDDTLIRQEAKNRGITVSQEEIDKAVQEGLAFTRTALRRSNRL